MSKLTVTKNELADRIGVSYPTASALVELMVSQGKGKEAGKRSNGTGKGKPSVIYELDEEFTISLKPVVKAAAA